MMSGQVTLTEQTKKFLNKKYNIMLKAIKNFHDKYSDRISVVLKFVLVLSFLATVFFIFRPDLNNNSNVSLPEEIQMAEVGDTLRVYKVSDSIYVEFVSRKK